MPSLGTSGGCASWSPRRPQPARSGWWWHREFGAEAAAAAIANSDRERRSIHEFYKIKDELPTHTTLVINTDVLTPTKAVEVIVAATAERNDASAAPASALGSC